MANGKYHLRNIGLGRRILTGNHGFYHQIYVYIYIHFFSVKCPIIQFYDWNYFKYQSSRWNIPRVSHRLSPGALHIVGLENLAANHGMKTIDSSKVSIGRPVQGSKAWVKSNKMWSRTKKGDLAPTDSRDVQERWSNSLGGASGRLSEQPAIDRPLSRQLPAEAAQLY